MLQSILVIGPTGAVGIATLRELIRRKSEFKRIAAFNNTASTPTEKKTKYFEEFKAGGVEIVTGNYDDVEAFKGFDTLIMALGNLAIHLSPRIIDTAITAGIRHFYPSEFGADLKVGDNWTQRYYKFKAEAREHLELRAKDTPGLGWSYVMIGRFTEWSVIKYFGIDNKEHTARIYGSQEKRQSLLSVPDAASYIVGTLLYPIAPTTNKREWRFLGQTYTWTQIFDALERVTGHKYAVTYLPVEDAIADEKIAKETGNIPKELEASHRMVQGREGTLLQPPYDNDKLPEVKPQSIDEVFARAFKDPEITPLLGIA